MRFRSHDIERVESTWQQYVPSAVLHSVDPQRFRFDWDSAELATATLVRYGLAAEVRSTAEPEDQILVCRVDAADAWIGTDRGDLDADQPWISDGAPVHARWTEDAEVRALIFDRAEAERLARRITGDDRLNLRVKEPSPHSDSAAKTWEQMFRYVDASRTRLTDADTVLRAELERHALAVTLSTFSTSLHEAQRRVSQSRTAPVTVRRALAFIDENAHRPITVDDVAEAVHISTRGLQYAFRRSLDASPAEYLRRARLEGAHRELLNGSVESIAVISRRWGYAHPSRFAAAYRLVYGTSPAVTAGRRLR